MSSIHGAKNKKADRLKVEMKFDSISCKQVQREAPPRRQRRQQGTLSNGRGKDKEDPNTQDTPNVSPQARQKAKCKAKARLTIDCLERQPRKLRQTCLKHAREHEDSTRHGSRSINARMAESRSARRPRGARPSQKQRKQQQQWKRSEEASEDDLAEFETVATPACTREKHSAEHVKHMDSVRNAQHLE